MVKVTWKTHSEDGREINNIASSSCFAQIWLRNFSYICVTHANINFVLVYFILILKYKYCLCLTSRLSHMLKWFPEESFLKIALQFLLWRYLKWFIHACIQLLIYLCIPKDLWSKNLWTLIMSQALGWQIFLSSLSHAKIKIV